MGAGGKERRLAELLKALSTQKEIEFELVIMSNVIHYAEIHDLGLKIHYLIRTTKKDIFVFQRLYHLCKIIKPDIIHCWDSMTAIYSVLVCKLLCIPLINGMITNSPGKWIVFNKYWLRAKITFPFSDHIVGNSMSGVLAYGVANKKSHVIYNGFNFNRIKNIIDRDEILSQISINTKYVVGMVATFSKNKDYVTFFKATQLILNQRKDVTFMVLGHNTDSIEAYTMIEEKNKQYFRLLGTKSDIESYVNTMDICVLSTFTEGISNSILEYMALAKPVVATTGGGTQEILDDKKTGFLVKLSDPGDLSEKIELLLQDEDLRLRMGTEGKIRIQKLFSIEIMLERYISLYHSIVSKS